MVVEGAVVDDCSGGAFILDSVKIKSSDGGTLHTFEILGDNLLLLTVDYVESGVGGVISDAVVFLRDNWIALFSIGNKLSGQD